MKLITGLGNPGKKYRNTRHNVGFQFLSLLKEEEGFPESKFERRFNGEVSRKGDFFLLKPLGFMNNSGDSVAALSHYYKIEPQNILVSHDDSDIPLGKIKIEKGRGSAGHRGVESIINRLGTKSFYRLRIGVGRDPKEKAGEIVLSPFSKEEEEIVENTLREALEEIKKEGF